MVEQVCLFLLKVVQSANGEYGKEKSRFGAFWTEGDRMEEGEVVMEQIEVGG